jgi:hypothetical protein
MENMTTIDNISKNFLAFNYFLSIFMHTNNNIRRQKWKKLIIVVCYLQYYSSWETYLSQHKNDENIKSIIYNDIILDERNKKNINLNC